MYSIVALFFVAVTLAKYRIAWKENLEEVVA